MIFQNKRAIMGIGTLIILIAMILVSAVAAGVIINSATQLQGKAQIVGNVVQNRLVTGVEAVKIMGYTDPTMTKVDSIEILGRLRAGSPSINLRDLSIILSSANFTVSPVYTRLDQCSFSALQPESEYCHKTLIGNNDTVIEPQEMVSIRFKLEGANRLETNQKVSFSLVAPKGDVIELQRTVPSLVGSQRVEIL